VITRISGTLTHLTETSAFVNVGAFEYEVYVPEFVRRQLQSRTDQPVTLKTIQYMDGNPQQGRLTPRMIGFLHQAEREFFELVCSVDGVGVKKALRAMVRPVREVATAIEEQDIKQLSTLPGVGPAVAERIVAKLRRKMARFALLVDRGDVGEESHVADVFADAYEALVSLGHSTIEARSRIDDVADSGKSFKSVEEILSEVYRRGVE